MKDMNDILKWIDDLNQNTHVVIKRTKLKSNDIWYYDKLLGTIHNQNNSFFSIAGMKGKIHNQYIEQPILLQDEIGYLGILCKEFDGEVCYLMQAKIEPGNINCVQISPTIQATKSNFTQQHGGKTPPYLEYFLNAKNYYILADQIQSEQSSRFYGKRNRNMILLVEDNVEVEDRFCWMTLSQIKKLMTYKNLVNMDTRTVLSCLPYLNKRLHIDIQNRSFYQSLLSKNYFQEMIELCHDINNYKMFTDDYLSVVKLEELEKWDITCNGIKCQHEYPYEVIYCDIEIEGREVGKWTQPLFKANSVALFGLIYTIVDNEMKFLVKIQPEIGCFDKVEIGPTIQKENETIKAENYIEELFNKKLEIKEGVHFDTVLSEEGGRFYHEENRNIVMEVPREELECLPKGYHLVSYASLYHFNLINNCLNIQLRNLLSTLEV